MNYAVLKMDKEHCRVRVVRKFEYSYAVLFSYNIPIQEYFLQTISCN